MKEKRVHWSINNVLHRCSCFPCHAFSTLFEIVFNVKTFGPDQGTIAAGWSYSFAWALLYDRHPHHCEADNLNRFLCATFSTQAHITMVMKPTILCVILTLDCTSPFFLFDYLQQHLYYFLLRTSNGKIWCLFFVTDYFVPFLPLSLSSSSSVVGVRSMRGARQHIANKYVPLFSWRRKKGLHYKYIRFFFSSTEFFLGFFFKCDNCSLGDVMYRR